MIFLKVFLIHTFLPFVVYGQRGFPSLLNCPNEKQAKQQPYQAKQAVSIFPTWSQKGVHSDAWVQENYQWQYKLVQINGIEISINVDDWLMTNKAVLTIPGYSLTPGHYKIYVTATPKQSGLALLPKELQECAMYFKALKPVVVVSGGSYKMVPSQTEVTLDGGESFDVNTAVMLKKGLQYEWSCTQKKNKNFCARGILSRKSTLTVSSTFVEEGEKFQVILKVTTPKYNSGTFTASDSFTQTIEVLKDASLLEIACRKNCPPATDYSNPKVMTFLAVSCLKNCENIGEEDYEWTVEAKNGSLVFDYDKNTELGRNNYKFIILKNVLQPGDYIVSVRLKDEVHRKGKVVMNLHYPIPPSVEKCQTNPSKGTILTLFMFRCLPEKITDQNFYELYAKNKKDSRTSLIVDGFFPYILNKRFMLPRSDQNDYFVKVITQEGTSKELPLKFTVKATMSNQNNPNNFMNNVNKAYGDPSSKDSISNIIFTGDEDRRDLALQKFRTIINEVVISKFKLEDEEVTDFLQNLKFRVVEDMLKAPFESINEVVQMSDSISKLVSHNALPHSDPLLGKFITTFCKKMMNKQLEMVRDSKFPLNLGEKSQKVSRYYPYYQFSRFSPSTLTECFESNTNPNYEVTKPIDYNITTEPPLPDVPLATENYPNYIDFSDDYYRNIEYLKESTYNIINASSLSGKIIAMTTAVGEKFLESHGKKSSAIVAKDIGKVLARKEIRLKGVVLLPSQDFAENDHPFDILVIKVKSESINAVQISTWHTDIMWWNPDKTRIATDIAEVEFWHSTCKEKVTNFVKPVKIFFTMSKKNGDLHIIEDGFTLPDGYTSISGEDLNYHIRVHRVGLPRRQTLQIQFYDIGDNLNVVITRFTFPTIEDFYYGSTTIAENSSLITLSEESYDIWCYVGILASKEATSSVTYRISFMISSCVRWNESSDSWILTCEPGKEGNASTISCECYNFSVIAGYVQNAESILQQVLAPDLELELQSTYVIFITLTTTVGLYCLFLTLALIKRKSEVYYLADNVRKDRFAYVIVIKTRGRRNSGTTSNIIVRLVGSKASSDPHVLNYPDPKLRLLQKFSKNTFLLTTTNHLGEIKRIDFWSDCIGPSPDWYCKDVLVYDMQQHSEWYFKAKKRLTVVKGAYIELTPELAPPKQREYQMWNFWHPEASFSYIKKLTTILSMILTIYVLVLVFHGVPTLQLKDGFDECRYYFGYFTLFVAFVSSLPVFVVHFVLGWFFRYSKEQYSKRQHEEILSFRITRICWAVLIVLIIVSVSFLVIGGFWVPLNKSLMWLTSSFIGTALGLFIYENVFVLIVNFWCGVRFKRHFRRKFSDLWTLVEAQRRILYETFGDAILRPYLKHLYKPLQDPEITEKQTVVQRRRHVISELEDLIMFGVYIIILYIVILANKDRLMVRSKTMMEEMMGGKHARSLSFDAIESVEEVYKFINQTLIPSIQPKRWYGTYASSEPAMLIDMVNKYIGIARIRQHRIKAVCSIAEEMRFLNMSCRPDLSFGLFETRTFGHKWGEMSAYFVHDRLKDIWRYSSEHQTGTFGTLGEFATYSGGGYVGYLGRTLYNTYANFRKFLQKFWFDRLTRSIFIEFLVYNANYNVFNSVQLLFEQSPSGYSFKTIEVSAVKMLFVENEVERFQVLFFVLFVISVAIFFFKQSFGVIRKHRTFYKDVWFMIDVAIIIMSMTCIGLFIARMRMVGQYLETLEKKKHNEFVNYFYLFYLEEFLKVFAAVLVCVATIRLWKFLRFGLMFRIMERTLSLSAVPLLTLSFGFFILLIGFSMTIVLLYGNIFEEIDTVVRLVRLLTIMPIKSNDLKLWNYIEYKGAVFYYTLYGFLSRVVITIYVTIIIMAYAEAQREYSSEMLGYTIKHYVQEQIKYIPKFLRYKYTRVKAGEETEKKKIEPKADKFIYSNSFSISTNRMLEMKYVAQNCIRRMTKSSKESVDIQLMLNICRIFLSETKSKEVEVFFKGRMKGKPIALVDEKRIWKIAQIVNVLLGQEKIQASFVEKPEREMLDECVKLIGKNQKTLKNCNLRLEVIKLKIESVIKK